MTDCRCGEVNRPVRRPEPGQQRVDHPGTSRSCRWCRRSGSPGRRVCGVAQQIQSARRSVQASARSASRATGGSSRSSTTARVSGGASGTDLPTSSSRSAVAATISAATSSASSAIRLAFLVGSGRRRTPSDSRSEAVRCAVDVVSVPGRSQSAPLVVDGRNVIRAASSSVNRSRSVARHRRTPAACRRPDLGRPPRRAPWPGTPGCRASPTSDRVPSAPRRDPRCARAISAATSMADEVSTATVTTRRSSATCSEAVGGEGRRLGRSPAWSVRRRPGADHPTVVVADRASRRAGTARAGGRPWSPRNRRISVTSFIRSEIAWPAAGSAARPDGAGHVRDHQRLAAGQRWSTATR